MPETGTQHDARQHRASVRSTRPPVGGKVGRENGAQACRGGAFADTAGNGDEGGSKHQPPPHKRRGANEIFGKEYDALAEPASSPRDHWRIPAMAMEDSRPRLRTNSVHQACSVTRQLTCDWPGTCSNQNGNCCSR